MKAEELSNICSIESSRALDVLTLLKITIGNLFVCDLLTSLITNNGIILAISIIMELFAPIVCYHVGEHLSRKIERRHIKKISYRQVIIGGTFSVSYKIVPEVILNEANLNKYM